ncbi:hypothetical protein [Bifidobacterium tissieri]|uniref:Uncharacterized protein n=1 Tax=Bifidobacterium tissieri TaxID=1630162 RepID=A0A5M9ZME1_9BIFI|nr:hypothetical protein [Bifidobacterium tissieri]KAA8828648.1 hypothetical protein EM849_11465 [Bifidobacterium tissieri]KAA8831591.1 hypothetical protein EMO89_02380 [Bifidobacterium tissieri]
MSKQLNIEEDTYRDVVITQTVEKTEYVFRAVVSTEGLKLGYKLAFGDGREWSQNLTADNLRLIARKINSLADNLDDPDSPIYGTALPPAPHPSSDD